MTLVFSVGPIQILGLPPTHVLMTSYKS